MFALLVAAPCERRSGPRARRTRLGVGSSRLASRTCAAKCFAQRTSAPDGGGEEASSTSCAVASSPPSLVRGDATGRTSEMNHSSIRGFLRDRTLVLTGATGFLAKVFLEKLLWEQPDVRKVFLVITPRAGKSAAARVREQIVDTPLFDRLRERHGDGFQAYIDARLVPVVGDLGVEGLGLSQEDERRVTAEAEVIVNSAATTTFNERFDVAVNVNTLGPRRLLRLSQRCRNLILMCHVSTAFVNGLRRGVASEQAFNVGDSIARELSPTGKGTALNPYAEVELALAAGRTAVRKSAGHSEQSIMGGSSDGGGNDDEWSSGKKNDTGATGVERDGDRGLDRAKVSSLDPNAEAELVRLGSERARMYGWQDTYVFTKAMGEQLLAAERGDVPLAIIRPSIIEGALKEPFPGWIEGVRMADPLILAYGKGLIRGFVGDSRGVIDLVPVDAVVSVMLASLPATAASGRQQERGVGDEKSDVRGETSGDNDLSATLGGDFLLCGDKPVDAKNGVTVYQVATSTLNPLNFAEFMQIVSRRFQDSPMIDRRSGQPIVADTRIKVFSTRFMFEIDTWLRQGITTLTSDMFREWFAPDTFPSADRRRRMMTRRTLEQLRSMGSLYAPYTSYEARFRSDNVRALRASLSDEEREAFAFELEKLNWEEYLGSVHIPGLLKHALRVGSGPPGG